jgi:hypothetical protein
MSGDIVLTIEKEVNISIEPLSEPKVQPVN